MFRGARPRATLCYKRLVTDSFRFNDAAPFKLVLRHNVNQNDT